MGKKSTELQHNIRNHNSKVNGNQNSAGASFQFGDEADSVKATGDEEKVLDLKLTELGLVRKPIPKGNGTNIEFSNDFTCLQMVHVFSGLCQNNYILLRCITEKVSWLFPDN
jgi:hypothetical protein